MKSGKDCIVSNDRVLFYIFNEHFINEIKTSDLKPSIISTTTNLPEIISAFKKAFFFAREVSVQVPFCKLKLCQKGYLILMDEKKAT